MGAGQGRNRTGIILLLIVLVVLVGGGIAAVLLLGVFGNGGGEPDIANEEPEVQATATPAPTATPDFIRVVVANRDIPRGTRLEVSDLQIVNFPDDPTLPPSLIVVDDTQGGSAGGEGPTGVRTPLRVQDLEELEGRVARVDILNNQPLQDFMITEADQPGTLVDTGSDEALLIPSGFVAITVPFTQLGMVNYAIEPGDHVDILASYRFVDVDEEFQTELPNSGSLFYINDEGTLTRYDGFFTGAEDEIRSSEFDDLDVEGFITDASLIIGPNTSEIGAGGQRPRQTTQMIIDNAIVLQVGLQVSDLVAVYEPDIYEPLVVTPVPPTPTPDVETAEGEEVPEDEPQQPDEEAAATPTPVPVPVAVTLIMTRQDALVLKYTYEIGADVDLVLRSFLDDNINDISTDSVTLNYILNVYGVEVPEALPVAFDPRIDLLSFGDSFTLETSDGDFGDFFDLDTGGPPGSDS